SSIVTGSAVTLIKSIPAAAIPLGVQQTRRGDGRPTYLRTAGRHTIHLYDSEEFMDRPTPVLFTAEADAEDVPDAPSPVPIDENARVNYRVRHEAVFALIRQLLDINISDRQPG